MYAEYTDEEILDLFFDLSLVGQGQGDQGKGKFPHIRISEFYPERKDRERAEMMGVLPGGRSAGGPLQGKASAQAKSIQNSTKLIRRSLAVVQKWGIENHHTQRGISNPWKPFREKLIGTGFSAAQILEIESRAK